jgi:hypothetical protein
MKKDNIPKDEKRRMFDFGQERDKEEKRKREKWCCERRREKKMKPRLF